MKAHSGGFRLRINEDHANDHACQGLMVTNFRVNKESGLCARVLTAIHFRLNEDNLLVIELRRSAPTSKNVNRRHVRLLINHLIFRDNVRNGNKLKVTLRVKLINDRLNLMDSFLNRSRLRQRFNFSNGCYRVVASFVCF